MIDLSLEFLDCVCQGLVKDSLGCYCIQRVVFFFSKIREIDLFMKCLCLVKKTVNVTSPLRQAKIIFEVLFSSNRELSFPCLFKIGDKLEETIV